jgi:hypothetical protein
MDRMKTFARMRKEARRNALEQAQLGTQRP